MAACDPGTATGLRDRAVVLLGFALLARRSELAALNLSDVELVPGEGLEVTIRSSKTDQSARGVVRRIHYASNGPVCPVRAVLDWTSFLAERGVTTGPLFTRIDRWGNIGPAVGGRYADARSRDGRDGRLRPQAIGAIVAALCESAGFGAQGAYSLCTAMRSHLIEHEVGRRTKRIYFIGGTTHSMRHYLVPKVKIADLVVLRYGLPDWVTRRLSRSNNYVAEMLTNNTVEWHAW